jgi:hypothetical protein
MKGLWPQVRSAWRVLWRSRQLDAEMREEMRFHIELESERLVRDVGLEPQEARRQAQVRFGGLENTRNRGATRAGCDGLAPCLSTRGSASACSSSTAG